MNRTVHILILLLLSLLAEAQRMPVSVATVLTPPYTTSLSAMTQSGATSLAVSVQVNDLTVSELPVKLHIRMQSAGITIESLPTQAVSPMFLGAGESRMLTGDDLAQYLRIDNLNFKGYSRQAYMKNGYLPSGLWKISVSVQHFHTGRTLSNTGSASAWITTCQPPVLTHPAQHGNEPDNASLPVTFSWQASKYTGGTGAIMYRLEVWEKRVKGIPAQTVAASMPPVYTTETSGLHASLVPAALAMEPGMEYCWRVTAYDPMNNVTFENGGESEIRTFQYLERCPEVCGLAVELADGCGVATWEVNREHSGGYNTEIYDDEGTFHQTLWGGSNRTAGMGGSGKTWHVRVQGICRNQTESAWSPWLDFTAPQAPKPRTDGSGRPYQCSDPVAPRKITNLELTDNLQKGDTIENERGTTKYIIHSAVRNDDGSFRGLSYFKASIWGIKVLGAYDHLNVNTDGVIIGRYAWKSVRSDMLQVSPEAMEQWADQLALDMAGAGYNNSIADTVVLATSRGTVPFETIAREGSRYYAVTGDGH